MKAFVSSKYLVLVSRIILGIVFILASIEKISAPEAFASAVQAYKLIPFSMVNFFALVIPWLELLCGLFLVAGIFVRASAGLLSLLLVLFMMGIVSAILRQLNIDCGCFGSAHASPVGWVRVLEDAGLFLLGVHLYSFPRSSFALENFLLDANMEDQSEAH